MTQTDETEIARFYTRSRRFPKLIGRLNDGTRIWGGPYTPTQFVVGFLVLVVGLATRGIWGLGSIFVDLPTMLLVAWAAAYGIGQLPATRRNPIDIALGYLSAVAAPQSGKYRGQRIRLAPPHTVIGRAIFTDSRAEAIAGPVRLEQSELEHTPAPSAEPEAIPTRPSTGRAPVSSIERLLGISRQQQ